MPIKIDLARSREEIECCYPVMAELRPHLEREEFYSQVVRQRELAGYRLVYLKEGEIKAVAGFRISECLAWGRFLYVDDLVVKSGERSKGYGGALLDWLVAYAREQQCDEFHLDSGVQRFAAHRFYLQKRLEITCHHFAMKLKI